MDCSPPDSSVHGILQARILQWVAIFSSRGSSQPRDQICISHVSCIAGRFFTCWGDMEASESLSCHMSPPSVLPHPTATLLLLPGSQHLLPSPATPRSLTAWFLWAPPPPTTTFSSEHFCPHSIPTKLTLSIPQLPRHYFPLGLGRISEITGWSQTPHQAPQETDPPATCSRNAGSPLSCHMAGQDHWSLFL